MLWTGGSVRDIRHTNQIDCCVVSPDILFLDVFLFIFQVNNKRSLRLNTNQISCCKGKWYVRRFVPDTVQKAIFILL